MPNLALAPTADVKQEPEVSGKTLGQPYALPALGIRVHHDTLHIPGDGFVLIEPCPSYCPTPSTHPTQSSSPEGPMTEDYVVIINGTAEPAKINMVIRDGLRLKAICPRPSDALRYTVFGHRDLWQLKDNPEARPAFEVSIGHPLALVNTNTGETINIEVKHSSLPQGADMSTIDDGTDTSDIKNEYEISVHHGRGGALNRYPLETSEQEVLPGVRLEITDEQDLFLHVDDKTARYKIVPLGPNEATRIRVAQDHGINATPIILDRDKIYGLIMRDEELEADVCHTIVIAPREVPEETTIIPPARVVKVTMPDGNTQSYSAEESGDHEITKGLQLSIAAGEHVTLNVLPGHELTGHAQTHSSRASEPLFTEGQSYTMIQDTEVRINLPNAGNWITIKYTEEEREERHDSGPTIVTTRTGAHALLGHGTESPAPPTTKRGWRPLLTFGASLFVAFLFFITFTMGVLVGKSSKSDMQTSVSTEYIPPPSSWEEFQADRDEMNEEEPAQLITADPMRAALEASGQEFEDVMDAQEQPDVRIVETERVLNGEEAAAINAKIDTVTQAFDDLDQAIDDLAENPAGNVDEPEEEIDDEAALQAEIARILAEAEKASQEDE